MVIYGDAQQFLCLPTHAVRNGVVGEILPSFRSAHVGQFCIHHGCSHIEKEQVIKARLKL
jgi:hypothetical protein